jgi:hypothetical protein
MAGYNPVSGGLLNMLTGGAYGEPTHIWFRKIFAERQKILEILYKINMVIRSTNT